MSNSILIRFKEAGVYVRIFAPAAILHPVIGEGWHVSLLIQSTQCHPSRDLWDTKSVPI